MTERPPLWTLLDGAAAFSFSMLVCLTIRSEQAFANIWGIQFIHNLTLENDGLMVAAVLLLFPSTFVLYGGVKMFFAAKEAVERKARERDERIRKETREEVLRSVMNALDRHGIQLPPDVDRELNGS